MSRWFRTALCGLVLAVPARAQPAEAPPTVTDPLPPVTIGDLVFNDADANGVQDPGEPGLAGVLVSVYRPGFGPDGIPGNADDSAALASQTTPAGGAYSFTSLPAGTYQVGFGTLAGYIRTLADQGPDATDSDANVTTGLTGVFAMDAGTTNTTIDAGFYQPVSIGNFVWNDTNANGQQDGGETGLDGVTVTLYRPGYGAAGIPGNADDSLAVSATTTAGGGAYSFTGLRPGIYQIEFGTRAGYHRTLADLGSDATDSDADAATGLTGNITLPADAVNNSADAGYYQPASVGDRVWNDTNANGQQDGGEPGIDGVTVTLHRPGYGADGISGNADDALAVSSATTAGGGAYLFADLRPGIYQLEFGALAGYSRTLADRGADASDSDVNPVTGLTAAFASGAGVPADTNDAGFYQPGAVLGRLYLDSNGNGTRDSGEPGLAAVNVIVTDVNGTPRAVVTDSDGNWTATVPPGSISANVDEADPDYPAGYLQTEGTDPTVVTAVSGTGTDAGTDGYAPPVDLGIVKSVNNPAPLAGSQVVFTLLATNHGAGAATGVAVGDALPSGYTFVAADPPAAYNSNTGVWTIGSLAQDAASTLTITAKVESGGNHLNVATISGDQPDPVSANNIEDALTTPIQLGAITGTAWVDTDNDGLGDTPLEGVMLTLVDGNGNPVPGESNQPVTTSTAPDGTYGFGGLPPGTYGVVEMQPAGFASLSDKDLGSPDEIRPIAVLAGETNPLNDFVEISSCPDTWADWKQLHPAETADGNPDQDAYDNLAEFAFAMPHGSGVTGEHLAEGTAWIIRPSTPAPGTLEGVFVGPKGADLHVTRTLQYKTHPGDPTWQETVIAIDTGSGGNATAVDNGDCTETVTIHDLEALTGLTGGEGVVRIMAELDEDGGNDGVDHTSFSEPEGWTETPQELGSRTYNNAYLRETVFTGAISGVGGQDLTFAVSGGSADLASLLGPGASYYLEVTACDTGDNDGQRFDITSASGNTVTLASDSSLHAASAPFNTLTGAPPVSLAGDSIAIRRHWTLGEIFPATGLGASGSQSSADQIQVFAGGGWTSYWLYDESDADPATARWVAAADAGMADQGASIVPPGQGLFFNNRSALRSILAYGEVRTNDFIRPLAAGSNLVGGGYPVDQSANGAFGRAMNLGSGFFGSRDFKTADSIFVWKADTTTGASGYDAYFLLAGAPVQPALLRWAKLGDASLLARDAERILLGNRSVFVRAKSELPAHRVPSPWEP